jgi:hypothetical protein
MVELLNQSRSLPRSSDPAWFEGYVGGQPQTANPIKFEEWHLALDSAPEDVARRASLSIACENYGGAPNTKECTCR